MNISMCGPIPKQKQKALELALKVGHEGFKDSNGWSERFKECDAIWFHRVYDEENEVDAAMVVGWKEAFPTIPEGYAPKDVFNL